MVREPQPRDYPDRVNAYIRVHQRWQATQPLPPLEPLPPDLEALFTPESAKAAQEYRERVLGEGEDQ